MYPWDDDSDRREAWLPEDAAGDLTFTDPNAWRGGAPNDPEAWRLTSPSAPALDPARPDVLEHGWPAADAGPEYLMWKERTEDE